MDNAKEELFWYLNKNYYLKDSKFFNKFGDTHEWGYDIIKDVVNIFSYEEEICKLCLTEWAYLNDLDEDELETALGPRKLKVTWSPEMAQDLQTLYGVESAEEQLVKILSEEISREIDAQILNDLRDEIKTSDDLLGVVKCLGYEPSEYAIYDPNTFVPKKSFVSTKYDEMVKERTSNPFWLKWVG
jgi:hypothetical protein